MKILITGGAGLIGSNLARELNKKNYEFSIVDNLWRGKIENLYFESKPVIDIKKKFYNLDLSDYKNCLDVTKNIDLVIHLADVVAGINYVFDNEYSLFNKNISINTNILNASIKNGVKKYLYVGTACSYPLELQNKENLIPLKEEEAYPANPESSYGWSKLMGEYEAELARKNNLIETGILRLHNVYGPPCDYSEEMSQVIPALCRKILTKERLIVWGSGNQKRSFIYVDDAIKAIMLMLDNGMNQGPIQIGSAKSFTIKSIAEKLVKISQTKIPTIYDKSKPEGDFDRRPDLSKAKKILGWNQSVEIDEGLKYTYEWVKKSLDNKKS